MAGLINAGGKLHGTTTFGGRLRCAGIGLGCGTVFWVTPAGVEKVVYAFDRSDNDATYPPHASLSDVGGTLYWTTVYGDYGYGTVFSVSP